MKIWALSTINHDGKMHAAGQALDVSTGQGESLIELGYATKTKPEKSTEKTVGKEADKLVDPQTDSSED